MRLDVVLISVVAVAVKVAADEPCSLVNPTTEKKAFLEKVKTLNGKSFSTKINGTSYTLNWCGGSKTTNAVVKTDKKQHIIGQSNETDVISLGKWNIVTFAGGELINDNSSCNGTRWKALILLECDPLASTNGTFSVVDECNAGCFAVFHFNTSVLCPVTPVPPGLPLDHTSRWTVFFMLIFTAGVCYLIVGMAYRRFVLGAKGLEQIPNYEFWRDPCGYIRDYCNRRDMRNNEPWSNSSNVNDNVDEPLLHP